MHGVYTDHQVWSGGYVHQLIKVQLKLQSDLCLCLFLGEYPNRWDHMCAHNNIHAPEYSCIKSLQTSDELREFLIVPDLTLYACLQHKFHGIHHLGKV